MHGAYLVIFSRPSDIFPPFFNTFSFENQGGDPNVIDETWILFNKFGGLGI